MAILVKDGGIWKDSAPMVEDGGVWKEVSEAFVKEGGVWKSVYIRAVPWGHRTSNFGTSHIYSVAHGNGLWVAAGSEGKLATSPNGVDWTHQSSGFGTSHIYSVAYENDLWVAAGSEGKLASGTYLPI